MKSKSSCPNISFQKLMFSKSRSSKIANSLSLRQCDFGRRSSICNDKKNRDESLFFWFSQQMRALAMHELMKNLIQRRKTMRPNRKHCRVSRIPLNNSCQGAFYYKKDNAFNKCKEIKFKPMKKAMGLSS